MRRRSLATLALILTATACTERAAPRDVSALSPGPTPTATLANRGEARPPRGPFEEAACSLPERHLRRIWNGYYPGRSGQIQIVPNEPDFVGAWFSHSGPWKYIQHVPLLFYGPGHVPVGRVVNRPVTLADIAPTHGALLDFDFDAPDGEALEEAVLPDREPPKVIVTMIWDSAGRNVLDEHPHAWPTLRRLMDEGTFFENATVGSSPSVTPAVHTTIGTGAFPRHHGIVDLRFQLEDGTVTGARGRGATHLQVPSLADLWDVANDNEPVIGLVGSEGTLGMLGHGALWPGGAKNIAVTRTRDEWFLEGANAEAFHFPAYASDFPGLEEAIRKIDLEDGVLDGRWHGEPIDEGNEGVSATPAFGEYQMGLVREVIEQEGFGQDDVPDLFYVNYREIDAVGHRWSMHSPQMEAVIRSTDRALADLIRTLDREVGRDRWVLTITADHAATPHPDTTGAFVISPSKLDRDLREAFDDPEGELVDSVRVTQIWMHMEELAERGIPLREVVSFVANYTKAQNASDPSRLSESERDEPVFKAAFPGAILEDPPCLPMPRDG